VSDTPDHVLVKQAIDGDQQAFGELVDRYQRLLLSVVRRRLSNSEEAEDVAQEAFLRAWQALDRLQDPARFGAWLSRIAANLCADRLRVHRIETVSIDTMEDMGTELAAVQAHDPRRTELIGRVNALAQDLPDPYREAFELRYGCGFSYRRIAEFLGVSEGTATNRLYRARKMILQGLEKEGLA
jgi:RNA polymerase sigma-70 factor (ECF subfamily)